MQLGCEQLVMQLRANRKHMAIFTPYKQMKRREHDWVLANGLSLTKWVDKKPVMLLTNSFNRKTRPTNWLGSKEKVKVSCPSDIHKYNQFIDGADWCDQKKVTHEFDSRSKFRFYLQVFFDFLNIAFVNSKISYHKIDSTPALTTI